jgi:oligopeptide/dipeptide ABC transporter ATP-binding protein
VSPATDIERPNRPPALELRGISVAYGHGARAVQVLSDVSFSVDPGRAFGIVGESGCGKTQTVLAALRLLPAGGRITGGEVLMDGRNILDLPHHEMRRIRGRGLALISQDALTALNPAMTIGRQMAEPLILGGMSREDARRRCVELLDLVGIPGAASRLASYPHELSGGMRQRSLIAMAISDNPRVLIADEPTTALDVTLQSQILRLIDRLRRDLGMALVLITHDLGVVAGVTDRVAVMYAGRIVETATTERLFARPRHPYTKALFEAIPKLDEPVARRLTPIAGLPPDARHPVAGCAYHPRCGSAREECRTDLPALAECRDDGARSLRCWVDPWRPGAKAELAVS